MSTQTELSPVFLGLSVLILLLLTRLRVGWLPWLPRSSWNTHQLVRYLIQICVCASCCFSLLPIPGDNLKVPEVEVPANQKRFAIKKPTAARHIPPPHAGVVVMVVRGRIPAEVIDEGDVKHPACHQCLSGCCHFCKYSLMQMRS